MECNALTSLDGLSGATSLTTLDLSRCISLADISSLNTLPALTSLDLSECQRLSNSALQAGLSPPSLPALRSLFLGWCPLFSTLPTLPRTLEILSLESCTSLQDATSISATSLPLLKTLDMRRCTSIPTDELVAISAIVLAFDPFD